MGIVNNRTTTIMGHSSEFNPRMIRVRREVILMAHKTKGVCRRPDRVNDLAFPQNFNRCTVTVGTNAAGNIQAEVVSSAWLGVENAIEVVLLSGLAFQLNQAGVGVVGVPIGFAFALLYQAADIVGMPTPLQWVGKMVGL